MRPKRLKWKAYVAPSSGGHGPGRDRCLRLGQRAPGIGNRTFLKLAGSSRTYLGGAHDSRSTSLGAKRSLRPLGSPRVAACSSRAAIAVRVMSSIGCAISVGRGRMTSAQSRSSTPMNETCSGHASLRSARARMTPMVMKLLSDTIAVGGEGAFMRRDVSS
jgi:hypothetical protein